MRIERLPVLANLEVQVRPLEAAGRAHRTQLVSRGHRVVNLFAERREVGEQSIEAVAVIDDH